MKSKWVILFLLFPLFSQAKNNRVDSLKKSLLSLKDSGRIDCLNALSEAYEYYQNDSAHMYALKAYNEAFSLHYIRGMGMAMNNKSVISGKCLGNNFLMKEYSRKAIQLFEKTNDYKGWAEAYQNFAYCYFAEGTYNTSLQLCNKAKQLYEKGKDSLGIARIFLLSGLDYLESGYFEEAFENLKESLQIGKEINDSQSNSHSLASIGNLYSFTGDNKTALSYYFQSLEYAKGFNILWHPLGDIGDAYYQMKKYDSALYFQ